MPSPTQPSSLPLGSVPDTLGSVTATSAALSTLKPAGSQRSDSDVYTAVYTELTEVSQSGPSHLSLEQTFGPIASDATGTPQSAETNDSKRGRVIYQLAKVTRPRTVTADKVCVQFTVTFSEKEYLADPSKSNPSITFTTWFRQDDVAKLQSEGVGIAPVMRDAVIAELKTSHQPKRSGLSEKVDRTELFGWICRVAEFRETKPRTYKARGSKSKKVADFETEDKDEASADGIEDSSMADQVTVAPKAYAERTGPIIGGPYYLDLDENGALVHRDQRIGDDEDSFP